MATVLIVEDNEPSRDALARRLERRGFTALAAVDGRHAVALARAARPDLILMDLGLPGINGFEATRRLKSIDETKRIPIIVLSAHAMTHDRDAAIAAGADDFDSKPVTFQRLVDKIESLLSKGTSR
ncbi:MAG TPA: response regulator [Vicinamibacterales bacterium]|jgi:CheY-like chemotaxis protein|nr:response regulator [Vicinamibacterales bacterium]